MQICDKHARVAALAQVIPHLTPTSREAAATSLAEAVSAIRPDKRDATLLKACSILADLGCPDAGLRLVRTIEDEKKRSEAVASLKESFTKLPPHRVVEIWRTHLLLSGRRSRSDLLSNVSEIAIVLAVVNSYAPDYCARAILDAGRWWP
jgi:hypothetical protein